MRAIAAWAFWFDGIDELTLTVDADNAVARRLYARLGFDHLFKARGARRAWP